jgi:hypothetical protein
MACDEHLVEKKMKFRIFFFLKSLRTQKNFKNVKQKIKKSGLVDGAMTLSRKTPSLLTLRLQHTA